MQSIEEIMYRKGIPKGAAIRLVQKEIRVIKQRIAFKELFVEYRAVVGDKGSLAYGTHDDLERYAKAHRVTEATIVNRVKQDITAIKVFEEYNALRQTLAD